MNGGNRSRVKRGNLNQQKQHEKSTAKAWLVSIPLNTYIYIYVYTYMYMYIETANKEVPWIPLNIYIYMYMYMYIDIETAN